MTKQIPLTQGKVALIDDEDFERVSQYKWYVAFRNWTWYVDSFPRSADGSKQHLYLHRFIMRAEKGQYVDHINRDGLDCRKSNLRICTNSENMQNSVRHQNNISGYKGVNWSKQHGRWVAKIKAHGKCRHIGLFDTVEDAAHAYDKVAKELFGEFARTNF